MTESVFSLTQLRNDPAAVVRALEAGESVVLTRRGEVAARINPRLARVRPSEVLREHAVHILRMAVERGLTTDVRVLGAIARGEDVPGDPIELLVEVDRERQGNRWAAAVPAEIEEHLDVRVEATWVGSTAEKQGRLGEHSVLLLSWAGLG